ncbi:MAG: SIS domain-containing protein [Planctomycetota bacterium]
MGIESHQWKSVLDEHLRVARELESAGEVLDAIADAIVKALRAGRRVYIFGNGGSAADAQHIAAELLGRFLHERRALPAVALTTDSSSLTAISNDLGFERVFARQLEGLAHAGDVVWALSTSGDSPNVLAAVRLAVEREAVVVGFTGAAGDKLAELCTHVLRVPHTASARIQEGHTLAYHYICQRVDEAFAGEMECSS